MYIPRLPGSVSANSLPNPDHGLLRTGQQYLLRELSGGPILDYSVLPSSIRLLLTRVLDAAAVAPTTFNGATSSLHRRDSAQQNTAMIGAVVGVLLSVFLIGSCVFLYYYRDSLRQAQRKRSRRRRRKSRGSKSSKSSKGSEGGGQPPPPT
ncbi:hypothetical protein MGN70_011250 [Eutypa lata]|nr:hypothetical protein MGN70_011250 [Eutypa lata]